jgi:hypothetical protein
VPAPRNTYVRCSASVPPRTTTTLCIEEERQHLGAGPLVYTLEPPLFFLFGVSSHFALLSLYCFFLVLRPRAPSTGDGALNSEHAPLCFSPSELLACTLVLLCVCACLPAIQKSELVFSSTTASVRDVPVLMLPHILAAAAVGA